MWWIFFVVSQVVFVIIGFRQQRATGQWSWSKLAFTLAFAALECALMLTPIFTMDTRSTRFLPVFGGAGLVAALNFIWFIVMCRRWKLPDGRTSLQANLDARAEAKRHA